MPSVIRKGKGYQARVRVKGVGTKCRTFPTRILASKWASLVHVQMLEGKYFGEGYNKTLAELIDMYLERSSPHKHKHSTYKTNEKAIRFWREHLGSRVVVNVKMADIVEVRDKHLNVAAATCNRYVAVLSGIMQYACEREWIDKNPCQYIKKLYEGKKRERVLTDEEWILLAKYASDRLYCFMLFALETGARLGEIERLGVNDYQGDICTFVDTKNKDDRTIKLSHCARSSIEEMLKRRNGELIFGQFPRKEWNDTLAIAGIVNLRFHDLRHTFITGKIAEGVAPYIVGSYVGHRTLAMTAHYTHLTPEQVGDMVFPSTQT